MSSVDQKYVQWVIKVGGKTMSIEVVKDMVDWLGSRCILIVIGMKSIILRYSLSPVTGV